MALYQLIYQSRALVPFATPELMALLLQARGYNGARHLTGLLLYTPDGRFMQVLEGDKDAVRQLYCNRILADPRHADCRVLHEGPCAGRCFPQWSMGFRVAQADNLRTLLGYVAPDNLALLVPRPHTCPELLALLRDFVAQAETEALLEHPW